MSDDTISRQAAIDALKGFEFCHYMEFGEYIGEDTREVRLICAEKAQDALRNLPSAQPEPCEDAVGREAVSEWLKQYGQDVLHGKYKFSLMYIWKNLTDLPSVQIKRKNGKWIYNSPVTMKCNQCGFVIKDWDWHRFKCCPNCGANMKGEQDD